MGRTRLLILLLGLVSLLLAACTSGSVNTIYTAAGDGTKPDDLTKTSVFKPDDDLNIVVKLSSHSRELAVYAVFTAPSGVTYATDTLDATITVGEIVLGLDWEAMGGETWPEGTWTAAVFVNDEQKGTIAFQVESNTASG